MRFLIILLLSPLLYCSVFAQEPVSETQLGELTIEKIMRKHTWIGHLPMDGFWADDSKTLYFNWNTDDELLRSRYAYSLETEETKRLNPKEDKDLNPYDAFNTDRSKKAYKRKDKLFLKDLKTNETQQIFQSSSVSGIHFAGENIAFMQSRNLYLLDEQTGFATKLTDYKKGSEQTKEEDKEKSDYEAWNAKEEMDLINTFKRRKEEKEKREAYYEPYEEKETPTAFYFGDFNMRSLRLSPTLEYATFTLRKENDKGQKTIVPSYLTQTGLTEDLPARSNVGRNTPSYKLGITDLEKDTTFYANVEALPGVFDRYPFAKDFDAEKPKATYIGAPIWSNDGKYAVVIVQSLDNKDRWIAQLNPETGELTSLDHQHDEAWIGGPGISQWRSWTTDDIGFLPDNETVWFQSEESGWSHLYILNVKTGKKKQLTKGKYEVFDPQISKDGRYWYFTSSEVDLGERHFYRMLLRGGKAEQLTKMKGNNQVEISPDEQWLLIRHSYCNQPWEYYLQPNRLNAPAKKITNSLSDEFKSYNWRVPELVTFKAEDGTDVKARLYRPENPQLYGSAVVFVHGAGYLQNAHHWWSTYFREYMFHNLLVDQGYTVLDIDYRGSSGYGSKFRTDVYRHMGGKDLSDHIDGAKYLVKNHSIDRDKIGIYGGSYGGFITLMALFTEPNTFACGAALRTVTDWAHYNHGYTANRLNIPWEDSLAYRQSSPIYFAEGLNKPLVMLHGMIDTNVHFQDVVRLSQRLIELGKEDWELAVFPLEGHGFVEPESWTDEYKRILKLFNMHLR